MGVADMTENAFKRWRLPAWVDTLIFIFALACLSQWILIVFLWAGGQFSFQSMGYFIKQSYIYFSSDSATRLSSTETLFMFCFWKFAPANGFLSSALILLIKQGVFFEKDGFK